MEILNLMKKITPASRGVLHADKLASYPHQYAREMPTYFMYEEWFSLFLFKACCGMTVKLH
jgi:hypothetical protein